MFFKLNFFLQILLPTTSTILFVSGQDMDQCFIEVENQSMNTNYSNALDNLIQSTPTVVSGSYNSLLSLRDYTKPMTSGKNIPYNSMKEACEAMDHTVCSVTTTVQFNASSTVVKEISKPVCFPESCDDSEVYILDPEPLFCGENEDCKILKREVFCPQRGQYENGRPGNCTDDATLILSNDDIMRKGRAVERRMESECINGLYGSDSDWCTLFTFDKTDSLEVAQNTNVVNKKNIESVNIVKDFSSLKGQTFKKLKESCEERGHSLCTLDTEATQDIMSLFEIAKPICIPDTCSDDSVLDLDPHPICEDSSNCEIVSTNVTCPSPEEGIDQNPVQCEEDKTDLKTDDEISSLYSTLMNNLNKECNAALLGQDVDECKIVLPTEANITIGSEVIEDNEAVTTFENTCLSSGNQVCKISGVATKNFRDSLSIFDVVTKYNEMLTCVPTTCVDDEMKVDAVNKTFFGCSEDEGCMLSDVVIECVPLEPSPFPSIAPSSNPTKDTEMPSSSPTTMPSVEVSTKPSTFSEVPTLVPSKTQSDSPSSSPSLRQSMTPSTKPSVQLSTEPTTAPTVLSSSAPSLTPSTNPTEGPSSNPRMDPDGLDKSDTSSASNKYYFAGTVVTILCSLVSIV